MYWKVSVGAISKCDREYDFDRRHTLISCTLSQAIRWICRKPLNDVTRQVETPSKRTDFVARQISCFSSLLEQLGKSLAVNLWIKIKIWRNTTTILRKKAMLDFALCSIPKGGKNALSIYHALKAPFLIRNDSSNSGESKAKCRNWWIPHMWNKIWVFELGVSLIQIQVTVKLLYTLLQNI